MMTEEEKALERIKKRRLNRKKTIWDHLRRLYARYKIWRMKKDDPFIYED
jgi:hypothetical protein